MPPIRIGHGHDLHRLQPAGEGRQLMLGGVGITSGLVPVAHSDGDVLLHALTDALLGAIGAGDIGDAFPNTDPRWKGAASTVFLQHAIELVKRGGYSVMNADCLVTLEKPKLAGHKTQIAANLSRLLGAPVNLKAGTNEGVDAIGKGEAIAATVVVLIQRV